ncbi:hypothetical protein [Desulfovibrio inopinatus]|uniref:hypothetical protein n=1 Tax=Desulfovibrio inopinatus TaxID=102109 RepID=UPI0003FC810C|nr:hypothetical protein [Desulfovibrio inopinatus]
MTLLFDDAKKLEKAVGEEAAEIIVKLFEAQDAAMRKDLATKADLELGLKTLEVNLVGRMAETKAETIKWVAGLLLAQAAVIAALVKLLT